MPTITQNPRELQVPLSIVAQQIHDIYIASITQSHQILLDGYHQIGQLILALPSKYEAVQDLARLTKISKTTLYNSARFVEKYPDMLKLPEGDNTTWNKMVTKYLPEQKKEEPCQHEEIIKVCKNCRMQVI
jgi:hypothetical protein